MLAKEAKCMFSQSLISFEFSPGNVFFCTPNTFRGQRKHLKRFVSTKKLTNNVLRVRTASMLHRVQDTQVWMAEAGLQDTC